MDNVILKIRKEYHEFSNSQKLIADFIMENRDSIIDMTAHEIGVHSGSSSASVVRFAKNIGFSGLESLKRQIAIDSQMPSPSIDPIIKKNDGVKEISEKVNELISNGLKDLFYQIDIDSMEAAIESLRNANKIFIFGIGASALPAYDLYHKLNRVNKTAIFDFDNHMTLEFIHYAKENDVVLSFSYSGNSIETIFPVEAAKEKGIKTISVTSNPNSRLGELSDIILNIPRSESVVRVGAFTSKINSMVVADVLYFGIISPNLYLIEKDLASTSELTRKLKGDQLNE